MSPPFTPPSPPVVLTQSEIDGGEVVGDATVGVTDIEAEANWAAYSALNAIVPERILRVPVGSRGDIDFAATWSDDQPHQRDQQINRKRR